MVLGIISTTIGAIIAASSFLKDVSTVQQQVIQYLGFVCASIFAAGGFIILSVKQNLEKTTKQNNYVEIRSNETKWNCPKCNNSNPNSTYQCEKCGYKLA